MIHQLAPAKGSKQKRKRIARGQGSGHGKTACRGHKGQKSRSGGGPRPGFEGGQMPLQRRLPKRGFTNIFKKRYNIINIQDLDRFEINSKIDFDTLKNKGLIRNKIKEIKLLAKGDITKPISIQVNKISIAARKKLERAGGMVEIV